jgi:phage-related protein
MPHSRPMPAIGPRCHELRVIDANATWRLMYRVDRDAVVIVEVFAKTTAKTPREVIDTCIRRLREYDHA